MRRDHPTFAAVHTTKTRLGALLVAHTARGVAAVWLGEDADALQIALREARPDLDLDAPETRDVRRAAEALATLVDDGGPTPDLPLDLRGTPWQMRVWSALRELRPGSPRSYGAIARDVGAPLAARAVARACATNDVALLIPCHRVVRADGAPGGYRWGAFRKELLLHAEAAEPSPSSPPPHSPVQREGAR
jgi:AraC family transcriptional regulator of adaptative response/methylated-DNA-[protein]-cysteine methyltransferase